MLSNHRLGKRVPQAPGGGLAPESTSQVEQVELELGQETVACSAQVVGKSFPSPISLLSGLGPVRDRSQDVQIITTLLISAAGVDGLGEE